MSQRRALSLPVEGAGALRTVIGIMSDHDLADPYVLADLDERLEAPWDEAEWSTLQGEEREVELTIEEAGLLLDGLAATETMSAHLPWLDMLMWVTDFVAEALRRPWSEAEWAELVGRT